MSGGQIDAPIAVPVSALALTGGAAAAFVVSRAVGFTSESAEDLFVVTWLLGWFLTLSAAVIGVGYALLLGLRTAAGRPVPRSHAALTLAALVLLAVVIFVNPLWGRGSAAG